MYDEQRGMVTARKAYDLIVTNHKIVLENDIMMKIWSFNLPLKIKCFVWIMCYKKINTWDTLCKKGWCGPNRCCLCKEEAESVEHLFVSCRFLKEVIGGLSCILNVYLDWSAHTFQENLTC